MALYLLFADNEPSAEVYALGYLYEHRDEADHKQLMLTLRSILFAVREGVF